MTTLTYSYHHIYPEKLPHFGFKIHLSATIDNYKDLFRLVFPFLEEKKVGYKYIEKDEEVFHSFSVSETMAESGKYFTIYPETTQECIQLLEELYQLIPSTMEGIYIMSDRPYKDSKTIFYRFGTIKWDLATVKDGHPTFLGPNGEEWQDFQKTYFDLPNWMEDIQPEATFEDSYLSKHYEVSAILKESSGGNVYEGRQLDTGKAVILKEARPHILYFDHLYKSELRHFEFERTQTPNLPIPLAIEHVSEWIYDYYIYQKIEGTGFYEYAKNYTIFAYHARQESDFQDNLKKFRHFLTLTKQVLSLIQTFHEKNLILHDIHPDNLLVTGQGQVYFIDLEHTYDYHSQPLVGVYHDIALKKWNQLDGKVADRHKVGNLLLYVLAKLQVTDELTSETSILNLLLENYGIYTNFSDLIEYLFSENADIHQALELFSALTAQPSRYHYSLMTEYPNFEQESPAFSDFYYHLTQIATISTPLLIAVHNHNFPYFMYLIQEEKELGLTGSLGQLLLLKSRGLPDKWFEEGLTYLLQQLVEKDGALYVPLDATRLSPYLNNGNAGFIKALLYLNPQKYRQTICSLAKGIYFEFAQFVSYKEGMLGIADSLLDVYEILGEREVLYFVDKLLVHASFYLRYQRVNSTEFSTVWKRYKEIHS